MPGPNYAVFVLVINGQLECGTSAIRMPGTEGRAADKARGVEGGRVATFTSGSVPQLHVSTLVP